METAAIEVAEEVTAVATAQAVTKVAEEAAAAAMVVATEAEEVAVLARAEAAEADEAQALSPLALVEWGQKAEGPPEVEKMMVSMSMRGSALRGLGLSKSQFSCR